MAKSDTERLDDQILTTLKHAGGLTYNELSNRLGSTIVNRLVELVQEGKLRRNQTDNGTIYALAFSSPRDVLKHLVDQTPAIKGVELVTNAMEYIHKNNVPHQVGDDLGTILNDLVAEGELIEVEYTLSTMNYRIKSLYFTKDTVVNLVNPQEKVNDVQSSCN
jgi:DNA-binding Lrp family transcriptional regulator